MSKPNQRTFSSCLPLTFLAFACLPCAKAEIMREDYFYASISGSDPYVNLFYYSCTFCQVKVCFMERFRTSEKEERRRRTDGRLGDAAVREQQG